DSVLLGALLKQLFGLTEPAASLPLLQRLVDDSAEQRLLQHPAIQLHLLQRLLRAGDGGRGLLAWRRLSRTAARPPQLPALTLQLAKQLGQRQDLRGVAELGQFMGQTYPEAEQTQQLRQYQQHLAQ
ncbi:MAG TPA: rhomboid family intramembrane serine protease, partial [Pseudomonas sp.]|nr:rhomboid family intramembrane serine protease [Pseudomonas sp.]